MSDKSILKPYMSFNLSSDQDGVFYVIPKLTILEGREMENVDIFYDHLEFLRPFGIFCGNLVHFFIFGMLYPEKSGNPAEP
jgi:hypothetical protein